jgi:hypothetical protein
MASKYEAEASTLDGTVQHGSTARDSDGD